jgi:hypothetical protein
VTGRRRSRLWGPLAALALGAGVLMLTLGAIFGVNDLAAVGVLALATGLVLLVPYLDGREAGRG